MTYSSGSLIQAVDYNNFLGSPTANNSGQINSVISTGKGNAGYGQPSLSNVTGGFGTGDTITAAQWTTLVNAINTARKHQSAGGFTNIGTYTAGTIINANVDINANIFTAFSTRLTAAATSTVTGSNFPSTFTLAATTAAQTFQLTRTATFANANAVRYFFNAGGSLTFAFNANGTNNDGTTRSADLITLAQTNLGSKTMAAQDCTARTGTGGTLNTDLLSGTGYYVRTTSNVALTQVTSTAYTYTGDNIILYGKTNGVQGSNSDNGTVVSFGIDLTSAAKTGTGSNQSINITLNTRVDVKYPATTFLANTWGAVTIA